jgi:colanic acid biosynthesis glycosyl transferase WcaI
LDISQMNKKQILIIQQYFYPDISAVSQLLVDLLSPLSDEYEVTVLCSSVYNSVEKYEELPESINGVKILRIRGIKAGKKSFFHRHRRIFDLLPGGFLPRSDASGIFPGRFHDDSPLIGFFAALGNIPHRRPLIQYVEDLYPELLFDMGYISSPWIIRRLAKLSRFGYRQADRVITLGHYMTRKIRWNYKIPDSKFVEIPNWSSDVEYRLPGSNTGLNLLYSGNAGLAHDFSMLKMLFHRMLEHPEMRFSFVGGGNQVRVIREYANVLEPSRAEFSAYVEKSAHSSVLASGDILLLSQRDETVGDILPSKLYSYLAAGRPMLFLGPRKSEIGELLLNEKIGVILEVPGDLPEVFDFILQISRNRQYYVELCATIRRLFDDRYSQQRAVAQFRDLLEEVLVF